MNTPKLSLQFGWVFSIFVATLMMASHFVEGLKNPILELLVCMWLVGTTTKYNQHPQLAIGTCLMVLGSFYYILDRFSEPEAATRWFNWLMFFAWTYACWKIASLLVHLQPKAKPWQHRFINLAVPLIFGLIILFWWENLVYAFSVPAVLLPAPSQILVTLVEFATILAADFQQTFLKAVLAGYFIGCISGFLCGVLTDKIPFLQRGLLPLGNFVSSLPIVGIAPIFVMWFGFDWQSKAAVVCVMTFFPMLTNTVAGLNANDRYELELMKTYNPSYLQTFYFVRLPRALPFIFNALKINSTLAMIGAIVAEFFGTPIVGMGFRISTEIGRLNLPMVWATIVVSAVAGSIFYKIISLVEKKLTFWHSSFQDQSMKK